MFYEIFDCGNSIFEVVDLRSDIGLYQGTRNDCEAFLAEVFG